MVKARGFKLHVTYSMLILLLQVCSIFYLAMNTNGTLRGFFYCLFSVIYVSLFCAILCISKDRLDSKILSQIICTKMTLPGAFFAGETSRAFALSLAFCRRKHKKSTACASHSWKNLGELNLSASLTLLVSTFACKKMVIVMFLEK